MESMDDCGLPFLNMLPPFLQSRLPAVPARFRSLRSVQSSTTTGSTFCNSQKQASRRSRMISAFTSNSSSESSSCYSDSTGSQSVASTSASSMFSRQSAATSLASILEADDDQDYPADIMADDRLIDNMHYERLMRYFLRSVRDMDTRLQLSSPSLSGGSQALDRRGCDEGCRGGQTRLPRNFSGGSHEAIVQGWSPSGIKWRYARQGAQLATDASNELHDASFERSAYIDAVAYYLRACPDQLDWDETVKLRAAAPWLATQPHPEPQIAIARPTDRGRTFLSDAVQYTVIGLIVLGHMLWCFLLSAFRLGAFVEREYHVSSWLTTNGIDLVNAVGKHSITLTARINALNNGRFGQVISWTVDSITGGFQEGCGKGMDRIKQQRAKRTQPSHN